LWSESVSEAAVHQRLSAHYRNSVLPQQSVCEWIEKLKNGRTSVRHEEGAGRPSMAMNEANTEHAHGLVLIDRQVTIDEVANRPQQTKVS
jgi:hypothetical protein